VTGTDKIRGLLEDGRRLLDGGKPREAALAFGRVLLIAPDHPGARSGLDAARAAAAEADRNLQERLQLAEGALAAGDRARGRGLLEEVMAAGGDRDRALALLERLDSREGRLGDLGRSLPADEPRRAEPGPGHSWSRSAFVGTCVCAFAVLGATVASSWGAWMAGLARTPAPRSAALPPAVSRSAPAGGEHTVARARRLMEEGDTTGAIAVLDAVPLQDPAYPFARQLRAQAIKASAAGRPTP